MTRLLAVIRHGLTEWNELGKIQGRTDIPLSKNGKETIKHLTLPSLLSNITWLTSPLLRAQETGKLLGITNMRIDERLIETNWGDWEGRTLEDLRNQYGQEMIENEKRGLDLMPPGGESPRQVSHRLQLLLREFSQIKNDEIVGAITHKGVIRSLLSLATGWDMSEKPPIKLNWKAAHIFSVDLNGKIATHQLNLEFIKRNLYDD